MSLFVPPRVDQPELLDEPDAPRADMERSLRDLRRINRYLGGTRVYRQMVRLLAGNDWRRASILDLGTGTSDLLEALGGNGLYVGLDFKIDHLLYSNGRKRDARIVRVVGDAQRLPFREGAIDIATSAHFIHHFTPDENGAIFRECLRIVRCGIAVNDTQRHRLPLLVVRLLGMLRLTGKITRFDAPASVRRGYTPEEARAIAEQAGASRMRIVKLHPFRVGILLWK